MAIKRNLLIFPILGLLIISSCLNDVTKKPFVQISKQEKALNLDNDFLLLFSVGQKRLLTGILWISTLLESDLEHYKSRDLNSWMFLRFNSLTKLDPKFLSAYQFGGQYLSIVKDDLEGAAIIFDRGLSHFPQDYSLNYFAAFLYGFELENYDRAIELYKKIQDHPRAPEYIKSIIYKFEYERSSDLNLIFKLLSDTYLETPKDSPLKRRFEIELYAIKAQIDLECLNSKQESCDRYDYRKQPYLKDTNGQYYSKDPFRPYRLRRNK